jgi:hypothetical protein
MKMHDITNHAELARQHAARVADKYIPAADQNVTSAHNNPPTVIDRAKEAFAELSAWLRTHPVVQTPDEAKEGNGWIERTRISLQEVRGERDEKTAPLNAALKAVRDAYDLVREKTKTNRGGALQVAYEETKARVLAFMEAETRCREAIAGKASAEAAEAERVAREAEAREREAIDDSRQGAEADVGAAIAQADGAFKDFRKAARAAQIAERDSHVRIGSVMGGRANAIKERRKLVVADVASACKALVAMGLDAETADVLTRRAKRYEEAHGELPPGVTETFVTAL